MHSTSKCKKIIVQCSLIVKLNTRKSKLRPPDHYCDTTVTHRYFV